MNAVRDYLTEIQSKYRTDVAGEHAYRPALQTLLEAADKRLNAVNDPARTKIGMPDFVVLRQPGDVPIGIVEAKDIGNALSRTEKTQQIKRYLAHGNLILTNYLEFRWYVNGEKVETVRIAKARDGKILRDSKAYSQLNDLLRRFAQQSAQSVNSAQELAQRLARCAQLIAHFIERDLKSDKPTASLHNQMTAFQRTLLPSIDAASFADMYAQTLAYGLFASRVNYLGDPQQFSLRNAADDIPRTNPFLRQLFHHSRFDLGGRLSWLSESLVEILRHTDMDSILAHFGRRSGQNDPVVHFYETFLAAYNPRLRERRGVYYTPEPVVKYIVRSVDHILKTRFNRSLGLADDSTLILDPAAGTGTFLYFVIEQIKDAFAGQQGLWKSYVEKHLLPRVFGFELLMAPYTVAHMNLSLQLKEAGYDFKDDERLGIYLTNTLEEAKEAPELPFAEFISAEANEAAAIKRDKPIMVVLGNPPYSYVSANKGEWISKLVRDYYFVDGKPLGERNPKALQDDYVKFIRFAQWRIEKTGEGILAFITNHTYLDGPTFRGMRFALRNAFDQIWILNLHGNTKRNDTTPDGGKDENVFDIQQGVAIILLVKPREAAESKQIRYVDLWGQRSEKYCWLELHQLYDSDWQSLEPVSPQFAFVPQDDASRAEYELCPSMIDIMPVNVRGFITSRDSLTIHNTAESLWTTVKNFIELDTESAREFYKLGQDVRDWRVHWAQADIRESGPRKRYISQISYRPFDYQYTYYTGKVSGFICLPRREITNHVVNRDNLCLLTTRQQVKTGFRHVWCVTAPAECCVISNRTREGNQVFPLYLYPKPGQLDIGDDPSEFPLSARGRRPNLSREFVSELEAKLGLRFVTEGSAFVPPIPHSPLPPQGGKGSKEWGVFGPEDVFYYAYAVFHSPTYRQRYAEFLKIDFPRLPLTADVALFADLVKLGAELVGLHLMKSPRLARLMTTFDVAGDNEVARGYPKYDAVKRRVHINKRQ